MPRGKQHGKATSRAKSFTREEAAREALDALETALDAEDPTTVAEVVERLSLLNAAAVAKECERRLIQPYSPASIILLNLLRTAGGYKSEEAMRRIANNQRAPDAIRIRAQRWAGWETTDVAFARMAFL